MLLYVLGFLNPLLLSSENNMTTLKQRVWAAVRNKPGMTAKEISLYFKDENPASVTSLLSNLDLNDMVYSKGNGYKQDPKKYFTDEIHFDALKAKRKVTIKPLVYVPIVETKPVINNRIDEIFNTLSINEGQQLYKRLHSMYSQAI